MISERVKNAEALFMAMIRNAKFQLSALGYTPEEILELESFTQSYRDKLSEIEEMEKAIKDSLK